MCVNATNDLQIICNDYPTFQFQFVNSFLSLFYIAFYLQDQERLKEVRIQLSPAICYNHMRIRISISAIGGSTHSSPGDRQSEGIRGAISDRAATAGTAEL